VLAIIGSSTLLVKPFGPIQEYVNEPEELTEALKLAELPAHTKKSVPAFTVYKFVMLSTTLSVALHPPLVAVTVYVPDEFAVGLATAGSSALLVNPFGPVQE